MILPIQIIGVFFALDMIFVTYFYYRRRLFSVEDLALWGIIWGVLFLGILFPATLEEVAEPLALIRVMDLLAISGFFILIALIFVLFVKARYAERRIEMIVKELALKKVEEGK